MTRPADAVLPGVVGLRGPLSCLNEARYGIVFGTLVRPATVWRRRSTTASTAFSSTGPSPGSS